MEHTRKTVCEEEKDVGAGYGTGLWIDVEASVPSSSGVVRPKQVHQSSNSEEAGEYVEATIRMRLKLARAELTSRLILLGVR